MNPAINITEHFTWAEFQRNSHGINNIVPTGARPIIVEFCETILEPIRERFGSVIITSGYRSRDLNHLVGGAEPPRKRLSDHVATKNHCAADFRTPGALLQTVFDWIRLESGLPFDQVILERGKEPRHELDDCIHISMRVLGSRRMALLGPTHGQGGYLAQTVLEV